MGNISGRDFRFVSFVAVVCLTIIPWNNARAELPGFEGNPQGAAQQVINVFDGLGKAAAQPLFDQVFTTCPPVYIGDFENEFGNQGRLGDAFDPLFMMFQMGMNPPQPPKPPGAGRGNRGKGKGKGNRRNRPPNNPADRAMEEMAIVEDEAPMMMIPGIRGGTLFRENLTTKGSGIPLGFLTPGRRLPLDIGTAKTIRNHTLSIPAGFNPKDWNSPFLTEAERTRLREIFEFRKKIANASLEIDCLEKLKGLWGAYVAALGAHNATTAQAKAAEQRGQDLQDQIDQNDKDYAKQFKEWEILAGIAEKWRKQGKTHAASQAQANADVRTAKMDALRKAGSQLKMDLAKAKADAKAANDKLPGLKSAANSAAAAYNAMRSLMNCHKAPVAQGIPDNPNQKPPDEKKAEGELDDAIDQAKKDAEDLKNDPDYDEASDWDKTVQDAEDKIDQRQRDEAARIATEEAARKAEEARLAAIAAEEERKRRCCPYGSVYIRRVSTRIYLPQGQKPDTMKYYNIPETAQEGGKAFLTWFLNHKGSSAGKTWGQSLETAGKLIAATTLSDIGLMLDAWQITAEVEYKCDPQRCIYKKTRIVNVTVRKLPDQGLIASPGEMAKHLDKLGIDASEITGEKSWVGALLFGADRATANLSNPVAIALGLLYGRPGYDDGLYSFYEELGSLSETTKDPRK